MNNFSKKRDDIVNKKKKTQERPYGRKRRTIYLLTAALACLLVVVLMFVFIPTMALFSDVSAIANKLKLDFTNDDIIFWVAPEADRFSIVYPGSAPTSNSIKENFIEDMVTVFNVASISTDTWMTFVTTTYDSFDINDTRPQQLLKIIPQKPYVVVEYEHTYPVDEFEGGTKKALMLNPEIPSTGDDNRAGNYDVGTFEREDQYTNSIDGVKIPADYVGKITVTVSPDKNATNSITFWINVNTVESTVMNTPASSDVAVDDVQYATAKFFVDNVCWRVLSKSIGPGIGDSPGHGTGSDTLIITEHAYVLKDSAAISYLNNSSAISQTSPTRTAYSSGPNPYFLWHSAANNYFNVSMMRNTVLPTIYNSSDFTWARDSGLVVAPDSTTGSSWLDLGGAGAENSNNGTRSSGYAPTNGIDGLFLLSNYEHETKNLYFGPSESGSDMASPRRAANFPDGVSARLWLRSSAQTELARAVNNDGASIGRSLSPSTSTANYKTNYHAIRPCMILRSFSAQVENDRFEIIDTTNTANVTAVVYIKDKSVYNVASSNQVGDTTTFTVRTSYAPKVTNFVADTSTGNPTWIINGNQVKISIPDNYMGDIKVTLEDSVNTRLGNITFTLHVLDLESTIRNITDDVNITFPMSINTSDIEYSKAKFYAGDWAWRVISKSLGPTDDDILILSEHLYQSAANLPDGLIRWQLSSGTYYYGHTNNNIRNKLRDIYTSELLWAQDFAVKPTQDVAWSGIGAGSLTSSSGNYVKDSNNYDGCFLLSYTDVFTSGVYGWPDIPNTANIRRRAANLIDGTNTVGVWLRTSSSTGSTGVSHKILPNGTNGTSRRDLNPSTNGIRPAMILRFKPSIANDRFEITGSSGTASANETSLVYIENGNEYNVASSDKKDTTFTVLSAAYHPSMINFNAVPAPVFSLPTDPYTLNGGILQINIPQDYVGKITVGIASGMPPTSNVTTFTLYVRSLQDTIENITLGPSDDYNSAKFYVDDWAWRVLSNTLGLTANTTGDDILIVSEHVYTTSDWGATTGNQAYTSSTVHNVVLNNIYKGTGGYPGLSWAYDYAVKPNTVGWGSASGSDIRTFSSGVYVKDDNNTDDACFLLSRTDVQTIPYFGWPNAVTSTSNTGYRRAANSVDGTTRYTWLRTYNNNNASYVYPNGENNTNGTKNTIYGIRPAMILKLSFSAQVENDRFEITGANETAEVCIKNGSIFNVASSSKTGDMTTFTVRTSSAPNVVSFDPDLTTGTPTTTINGKQVKINIPDNYAGDIEVTLEDSVNTRLGSLTFTLHVLDLESTIRNITDDDNITFPMSINTSDIEYSKAKFYAGDWAWRVISKSLGPTGDDVLILSEHLYQSAANLPDGLIRWQTTTPGIYYGNTNCIIREKLRDIYMDELQWAQDFAVKPTQDVAWSGIGAGSLTGSSGNYVKDSNNNDGYDGCFLLSYADVFTSGVYGWPNSTNANTRRAANLIDGTNTNGAWLRSSSAAATAYRILPNGASNNTTNNKTNASTNGIRPAMILSFPMNFKSAHNTMGDLLDKEVIVEKEAFDDDVSQTAGSSILTTIPIVAGNNTIDDSTLSEFKGVLTEVSELIDDGVLIPVETGEPDALVDDDELDQNLYYSPNPDEESEALIDDKNDKPSDRDNGNQNNGNYPGFHGGRRRRNKSGA